MSLMKLLSMSRSLTAGGKSGRYRMASKGVVPCFGSDRHFHRTFESASAPEIRPLETRADDIEPRQPELSVWAVTSELAATEDAVIAPEAPLGLAESAALTENETASPLEAMPALAQAASVPASEPASPSPVDADPGMVGVVKDWLRRKQGGSARSAKGRTRNVFGSPQGMLSLDGVQVMRNDLTDAEFEVRPSGGEGEACKPGMGGLAWSQMMTRYFPSERARV